MINWLDIAKQISLKTGMRINPNQAQSISGGCINNCYLLGEGSQQVFIKLNQIETFDMYQAEADGLRTLCQTKTIKVPAPLHLGLSDNNAFFAMHAIRFCQPGVSSYRKFGQQLAALHRNQKPYYGSTRNNTIGLTPQINTPSDNWFDFWRKHRLGYQLQLARENKAPTSLIDDGLRLSEEFHKLFDQMPAAACLHGDLWQGNWSFDETGRAVIFDPAHYFGDRETDLAMSSLFGEPPVEFYQAYQESYPLDDGYPQRKVLYNLYHILNHHRLFGGTYASQAHNMILYILSELK